ncbi:hypothetical protein [Arthrobacter antioxidans]|uniref:hypothetical protein n=1 Tax=Arthrobacter antioxidans TaxID=2895818 RepID=UPI001FFF0038|nr:hypothetical protein [Arthrobacter antioxidans]
MQHDRRVEIAGHLPAGVRHDIDGRFEPTEVRAEGDRTALEFHSLDDAALRALLELLWESGVAVLELSTAITPEES